MTIDSLENKDNFRLIDDILINELSFLPEMDKFLLKNTNLSIKEIASQLGFSTTNYFCSFFKKQTNPL